MQFMSTSIGYTFEKHMSMGRWRGEEEHKILEAVFGRTSNRVTISEKFNNIMSSNRTKKDFYFGFSWVGFFRSKLRVVLGLGIVVDHGFQIWIYPQCKWLTSNV